MSRDYFEVILDLDGVFADFLKGQHDAHGLEYGIANYPYPQGLWDMFSPEEYPISWATADEKSTTEFWENLPWMEDSFRLLCEIQQRVRLEDQAILTCPMMNEGSYPGKARWVRKNIKNLYTSLIMTKLPKWRNAHDKALLIDDADKNVDAFREHGGSAILVPRPWNSKHELFHANNDRRPHNYVIAKLEAWKEKVGYPYRKDYYVIDESQ